MERRLESKPVLENCLLDCLMDPLFSMNDLIELNRLILLTGLYVQRVNEISSTISLDLSIIAEYCIN